MKINILTRNYIGVTFMTEIISEYNWYKRQISSEKNYDIEFDLLNIILSRKSLLILQKKYSFINSKCDRIT